MMFFKSLKIKKLIKIAKNMQQLRENNSPNDAALEKEINIYLQLAQIHRKLIGKKKYPFAREAVLLSLKAASSLDHVVSQYELGKMLLDEGVYRDNMEKLGIFASEFNLQRKTMVYKEAHAYLTSAAKHNNIQAKRQLGLAYINGYGVEVDKDHGFDLIVDSIEQENAWDRIQKIFSSLDINKSTFFSELFKHRKKAGR
jgi:TPR repeat protein